MTAELRVLVSIRPFYGHLHPLVPLARALTEAGHGVAFATERSFCPVVERCGFRAFPAGLDPFAPVEVGYEFSAPVTRQKAQDVLDIAGAWPIDLILRDPTDFGAVVAADALEVPQATVGFAPFGPTWWWKEVLGSSLDVVRGAFGLPSDPDLERLHPWLYLDTVPAWLQRADGLPERVLRRIAPEPYQAPSPPGAVGLPELPDEPIVLVTLGTVFNRHPDLLGRLCRGARDAGVQVICTLGPGQDPGSAAIGQLRGAQLVDYTPLAGILPRCAAVISHGGYNTVLAALLQGVPLLLIPLGADNAYNAQRCVDLGVGLMAEADTVSEHRVAELVSLLVARPQFRDAAGRLALRTAALPPTSTAVPGLEQLVTERLLEARAR
jgi:UDP:flavonoid glycosyltransferase YjiC (YdhE family)